MDVCFLRPQAILHHFAVASSPRLMQGHRPCQIVHNEGWTRWRSIVTWEILIHSCRLDWSLPPALRSFSVSFGCSIIDECSVGADGQMELWLRGFQHWYRTSYDVSSVSFSHSSSVLKAPSASLCTDICMSVYDTSTNSIFSNKSAFFLPSMCILFIFVCV